jgi:hypothetical protein
VFVNKEIGQISPDLVGAGALERRLSHEEGGEWICAVSEPGLCAWKCGNHYSVLGGWK